MSTFAAYRLWKALGHWLWRDRDAVLRSAVGSFWPLGISFEGFYPTLRPSTQRGCPLNKRAIHSALAAWFTLARVRSHRSRRGARQLLPRRHQRRPHPTGRNARQPWASALVSPRRAAADTPTLASRARPLRSSGRRSAPLLPTASATPLRRCTRTQMRELTTAQCLHTTLHLTPAGAADLCGSPQGDEH